MSEKKSNSFEDCINKNFGGSLDELFEAVKAGNKEAENCLSKCLYSDTIKTINSWFIKDKRKNQIKYAENIFNDICAHFIEEIRTEEFVLRGKTKEEQRKALFGWFNTTLWREYLRVVGKLDKEKTGELKEEITENLIDDSLRIEDFEYSDIRNMTITLMGDLQNPCNEVLKSRYGHCRKARQRWTCMLSYLQNLKIKNSQIDEVTKLHVESKFENPEQIQQKYKYCRKIFYNSIGNNILNKLDESELSRLSQKALEKLTKENRKLAIDLFYRNKPYKQIMDKYGIPSLNAVAVRKKRLINQLKEIMIEVLLGL